MTLFKRFFPLVCLCLAGVFVTLSGLYRSLSLESLMVYESFLRAYVVENPALSAFIYMGLYTSVIALSLPGAALMTLLGGFLFGTLLGLLYACIGLNIGSLIAFLAARYAFTSPSLDKAWILKMRQGFAKNSFTYLLTLRIMPIFPLFAVNFAAGFLKVPVKTFVLGNILGMVPANIIFVMLGSNLESLKNAEKGAPLEIFLLLCLLGLMSLLPLLYKRYISSSPGKTL